MRTSHPHKGGEVIFLAGFVTDGGIDGFEWRVDRGEVEALRAKWIEEGDADVSAVREVARPEGDGEAVTKALDEQPELWKPREGEGRSDTEKLVVALDKAGHQDLAAALSEGVDISSIESQLRERGQADSWAAHCVRRVAAGTGSLVPEALACPRCGGPLEASAKVYFDVTATERPPEGPLTITGLEFSDLNDSYDGHPAAMEYEVNVCCAECGHTPDFTIAGAANERTSFNSAPPQAPDRLLKEARAVYERARDGQAAVEEWACGASVVPHVNYRRCELCKAQTPHIGVLCAVCKTPSRAVLADAVGAMQGGRIVRRSSDEPRGARRVSRPGNVRSTMTANKKAQTVKDGRSTATDLPEVVGTRAGDRQAVASLADGSSVILDVLGVFRRDEDLGSPEFNYWRILGEDGPGPFEVEELSAAQVKAVFGESDYRLHVARIKREVKERGLPLL